MQMERPGKPEHSANPVSTIWNQREMPVPLALAAATGSGYAGMFAGSALVGFIAHSVGLRGAFISLALLICLVPALNKGVNGS